MRIPVRPRKSQLRFNITPLIDIVFLLIIFFLVASHFVRSELQEPIELPEAREGESEPAEIARRLVITVDAADRYLIGARVVDLPMIEELIQQGRQEHEHDFEVRIRGDRRVPYSVVEPVLLACVRAGVPRVRFAVQQK